MRKQFIIFLLIFVGMGLIASTPAAAHRVSVFAWVEGNTIYTTAKFSGGRPAQESRVEVFDSHKKLLLQGKSDKKGAFSFPVPKIDDLLVVVNAGSGHRGIWQIKKAELKASEASQPNEPATAESATAAPARKTAPEAAAAPAATRTMNTTVNTAELEKIVQKVVSRTLDQKLHPLKLMIAESLNPDPGFKDIMGGLGYIFGLIGIAAYFQNRKRSSKANGPDQDS